MVLTRLATPTAPGPEPTHWHDRVPRWTCALVNNMPDAAFVESERQFSDLLDASSGDDVLDTRLYVMDGVPRGRAVSEQIAQRYAPISALYDDPPDVVIVTGANPVEAEIRDEPFWDETVFLMEWAAGHVQSLLASCLAAHAALAIFDGIERRRLPGKYTGVVPQRSDPSHPLAQGLPPALVLPHSRINSVPTDQLRSAGYRVPVWSDDGEWSVATREVDRCRLVMVQAHPEYGATSLLGEYQRDARRFVLGERADPPVLPRNCVASTDWHLIVGLQQRIAERDPALLAAFPFDQVGARAPRPWRTSATRLYANWLDAIPRRSR